jgi:hypothetical protein
MILYPELCAVLGTGFSVSMNLYNAMLIEGVKTLPVVEIVAAGQRAMNEQLAMYLDAGRRVHVKDEPFYDLLALKLEQAVHLYHAHNPMKDWRILQSEKTYEAHGNCRIDVLADPLDGLGPAVVDYKLKVKLDPEWLDAEIDKHAKTQQRFHYQWATGAKRFYIVLVVLAGNRKKITPYVKLSAPFGASPYYDSGLWLKDATFLWGDMASLKSLSPRAIGGSAVHEDKWGPCEYEDACLTHTLDEAAMSVQYVKIERSK